MHLVHDSVPIPPNMDRYELRARELEIEQNQRFEASGRSPYFYESRFEDIQTFLINRYRALSKTYKG